MLIFSCTVDLMLELIVEAQCDFRTRKKKISMPKSAVVLKKIKYCFDTAGKITLSQCLKQIIYRSETTHKRLSGVVQSLESGVEMTSARLALLAVVLGLWYNGTSGSADVFTTVAWLCVLQDSAFKFPVAVLRELGNLQSSSELVQVRSLFYHRISLILCIL